MCPFCLASLAIAVATTTGGGAAASALALRLKRSRKDRQPETPTREEAHEFEEAHRLYRYVPSQRKSP
jgi:hypothetical protein